jgi:hypothetical protein
LPAKTSIPILNKQEKAGYPRIELYGMGTLGGGEVNDDNTSDLEGFPGITMMKTPGQNYVTLQYAVPVRAELEYKAHSIACVDEVLNIAVIRNLLFEQPLLH